MNNEQWWLVRCEGGSLYDDFVEGGFVALGSEQIEPDLSGASSREELREVLENTGIWKNRRSLGYSLGVLTRFVIDMKHGDWVVTYDPSSRVHQIGKVLGNYYYSTDKIITKQHFRNVEWYYKVSRGDLSNPAMNSLASMQSLFKLNESVSAEFCRHFSGDDHDKFINDPKDYDESSELYDTARSISEITSQGRELIKDCVANLEWKDMEDLAAGVLRAMGYKTRMTESGSDGGRDIIASPDGLGFENPRIVAEIKHRKAPASAEMIRSFVGGLSQTDRGLYISTAGYTKDARYEADRSSVPVARLDIDSFVDLLLEHYSNSDSRVRSLVQLTQIWWPVEW